MDNASKALIMAGAILIAVALVGVGVYLYQSAAGTVSSGVDQLTAADMETKNSSIEQFEGEIKGSDLKQLVRKVNTYNANNVFPEELLITGSTITGSGDQHKTTTTNSAKYKVSLTYSNGWIKNISITTP